MVIGQDDGHLLVSEPLAGLLPPVLNGRTHQPEPLWGGDVGIAEGRALGEAVAGLADGPLGQGVEQRMAGPQQLGVFRHTGLAGDRDEVLVEDERRVVLVADGQPQRAGHIQYLGRHKADVVDREMLVGSDSAAGFAGVTGDDLDQDRRNSRRLSGLRTQTQAVVRCSARGEALSFIVAGNSLQGVFGGRVQCKENEGISLGGRGSNARGWWNCEKRDASQ